MLRDGDTVKLEPRQAPHTDNADWPWIVVNVSDTGFDAATRAYRVEPGGHLTWDVVVRVDVPFSKIRG